MFLKRVGTRLEYQIRAFLLLLCVTFCTGFIGVLIVVCKEQPP